MILGLILDYVTLDRSSLALGCICLCLVVLRWYLVLFGYNSLVFGADWLGDHQNGASAYVLHLSGSGSHLRVSSLIAVFLQIAPYVCSSPACNNQISLHRTKQASGVQNCRQHSKTNCTMCECVLNPHHPFATIFNFFTSRQCLRSQTMAPCVCSSSTCNNQQT